MEVESKRKRDRGNNKAWLMALVGLCGLAVILIITIVVVANLPKNDYAEKMTIDEEVATETDETPAYAIISASHEEYLEATESINQALEADEIYEEEKVLELYQQFIDSTENEYVKDMLTIDYYSVIYNYDLDKTRGEEVVNGLLTVDERLQNINSAVAVLDAAMYYERAELVEQYKNILNERQISEGVDMEIETDG